MEHFDTEDRVLASVVVFIIVEVLKLEEVAGVSCIPALLNVKAMALTVSVSELTFPTNLTPKLHHTFIGSRLQQKESYVKVAAFPQKTESGRSLVQLRLPQFQCHHLQTPHLPTIFTRWFKCSKRSQLDAECQN